MALNARHFSLACGIAALAALLYWPIRSHEWLRWDDFEYITRNPHIAGGLSVEGVRRALTSFHLANWFPLTWLSWMADFQRAGFDAGAFLTTNLILHAVDSGLVFLVLFRLTASVWRSAFVAAVFAVHPLHVESVAWAAARKDTLSGVFFLLALLADASDTDGRRRWRTAVCFALGFAAKPTVITLPFVLLLLDDWPRGRTRRPDDPSVWDSARRVAVLRARAPLIALAGVFAAVTFIAQRSGDTVQGLDALPVAMRVKQALVSYVAYLGAFVWPTDLAFFYPHRGDEISWLQAGGSGALLLAVTALAWRAAARSPFLLVGWLWYLGMLLPAIGLVQVGAQARADRYMYLPIIGLCIAVAWGAPEWLRGAIRAERLRVATFTALACAVVGALAWRSADQIPTWANSVVLFEHGLEVTRQNHVAHAQLAGAYLDRGRVAEAIIQYDAALGIEPDYPSVANNLAWLLATTPRAALRDPLRAVSLAEAAASDDRSHDPAFLDTLAAAYAAAGRFDEAVATLDRAIALARGPDDTALLVALRERIARYRAGRPYVEPERR